MKNIQISDAEWLVMKIVWSSPMVSAEDIYASLENETGWNIKTLKTLLSRLVKKNVLDFKVEGKKYLYFSLASKEDCVQKETKSFLEKIFDGGRSSLLLHFVENEDLTLEEIKILEKQLLEKKKLLSKH